MRVLLVLLEVGVFLGVAYFLASQLILPILRNEPIFPMARSHSSSASELEHLQKRREELRARMEIDGLQMELDALDEEINKKQSERYLRIKRRIEESSTK